MNQTEQNKQLTQDEVKELLKKRKEELTQRFDTLEERMKDEKYKNQIYTPESSFQMEGSMLSEILNMHAAIKSNLVKIQESLAMAYDIIDSLMDANADLTLKLMNKHLDNIDQGVTTTMTK